MIYENSPGLRLDEEHRYWVGDREIWGVSAVMADNRLVDAKWFDESSRSRGTAIHAELANIARGAEPFSFLDPDLVGWVKSGIDFLSMLRADGAEILGVEVMRHNALYDIAGTIDLVVRWNGSVWIFDHKSGKAARTTRFQAGAYDMILGPTEDGKPRRRAAVELQEDGGTAKIVGYNTVEHFHDANRFLGYLNTSRDRKAYGPKERLTDSMT